MMKLLTLLFIVFLTTAANAGAVRFESCEKQGLTSGVAANVLTVNAPAGFNGGGLIIYCAHAVNASNQPIVSCSSQNMAIVNQGGTITAVLSTQAAVAEASPGTATITVALSQTNDGTTLTLRATPTITNFTATSVVFSIQAILPSSADLVVSCL